MTRAVRALVIATLVAAGPVGSVAAADLSEDQRIVVSATRSERRSLDVPAAIDIVDGETLREGQPKINLSESLSRVPGLAIQDRQNYAQDLQLSIRGFGARSSFGIRGVKLYADGIPATMPDGQGQAANFSLSSAQRIEVMRGPIAALYGNASGGVIQVFTEDAPRAPTVTTEWMAGAWGARRIGLQAGDTVGQTNGIADWSRFQTSGYRTHAAAEREQFNTRLKWQADTDTRIALALNTLYQPETQDPLGLTRAQVAADPRQVDPAALAFNTRKTIRQEQSGLTVERTLDGGNRLRASVFLGDRQVRQFLGQAGSALTQAGGVVDLARTFGGAGLTWIHDGRLLGRPLAVTAGLEHETMQERRRGYVNNAGSMGDLRRDEDDRVSSTNLYAQADWRYTERASATLGMRTTRVAFDSRDHFIVGTNPDDSGRAVFSQASPVAGIAFRLTPELSLYGSAGSGFETPTFAELAYRNTGSGLNFALRPSRSSNAEVGLKGRIAPYQRITLAHFETRTRDEIVVDSSSGGRTTFKNAGHTRRSGWEGSWDAVLPAGFDAHAAWTLLDARFDDAYTSGSPPVAVPAGNRLPGVSRSQFYAELRWRQIAGVSFTGASGLVAALEVRHSTGMAVDDRNSDASAGYTIAGLRVGLEQRARGWLLSETLRIDNITNRQYIGSVIVAEANGRYFEPAPRRSAALIVSGRLAF